MRSFIIEKIRLLYAQGKYELRKNGEEFDVTSV